MNNEMNLLWTMRWTFCEQWDGPSVNKNRTFCEQWDGPSVNKNRTFCEQWDGPFVNNEMNLLWTMRWTFCEQEQDLLWTMRWTFCEQWDGPSGLKLKGPGRFTSENNFESLNWNVVLPDFLKLSVGTEYTWKFGVCKKNTTYNEIWILNFSFVFI